MKTISEKLFTPVDAFPAQLFLRFFGLAIILQTLSYVSSNFIDGGLLHQKFLFTYDFFSFIKPISAPGLKLIMGLFFLSGISLLFYRLIMPSLIVFTGSFLYFFLMEKSYYNNHFYLMLLMAFLFCFFRPVRNTEKGVFLIPYWMLLILQLQIVIVYFYGGVAKLNYDWLINQQPMRSLLQNSVKTSAFPGLAGNVVTLYIINYGGLVFDLCIGFLLWIKRTRKIAIAFILLFNALNFLLFNFGIGGDIGIFPFFMSATVILFASPERLKKYFSFLIKQVPKTKNKNKTDTLIDFQKQQQLVLPLLSIYLVLQLLLPLRHWVYPGNTSWTEKGSRFSWRMKANTKKSHISYFVKLNPADSLRELDNGKFINTQQEYAMGNDPVMIWQFAQFLGAELRKKKFVGSEIYTSAKVSMNNSPYYPVIDSTLDLLKLKHNLVEADTWILPMADGVK